LTGAAVARDNATHKTRSNADNFFSLGHEGLAATNQLLLQVNPQQILDTTCAQTLSASIGTSLKAATTKGKPCQQFGFFISSPF
jgi:hypothetical protein